jgi:hypothetical protein
MTPRIRATVIDIHMNELSLKECANPLAPPYTDTHHEVSHLESIDRLVVAWMDDS